MITRLFCCVPVVAGLVLAAGARLAHADVESELQVLDENGQVAARGEAEVVPGNPSTDTATSSATAEPAASGPRSAAGNAALNGATALPSSAGAIATVSGAAGTVVSTAGVDVARGTGNAAAASTLDPALTPSATGNSSADATVMGTGGSAKVATSVVFGALTAEAGAQSTSRNALTSSVSAFSFVSPDEFALSAAASSSPAASGPEPTALAFAFEREFLAPPLSGDTTFSTSQIAAAPGSFLAWSESWKGEVSGAALSVSAADTATSQTLGASSRKSDGVTNQSFTQAISVPADGGPLFTSAVAESSTGRSTYAASAVADSTGSIDLTDDGVENPSLFAVTAAASVAAFDGNGVAHADALAGQTYAETDLIDGFDSATLRGVAESVASVMSPNADVVGVVRVAGDGTAITRTLAVGVDVATGQNLNATGAAIAANSVVFDKTISNNRVVEGHGDRVALIQNAGQNSRGLININQDIGNSNNQANISAIALVEGPNALLMNDISGTVTTTGNALTTGSGARRDVITEGSFAGGSGILGINQSSGSLNQLTNVVALAVGIGANAAAVGDISLGAEHGNNERTAGSPDEGPREDRIDGGAFAGFSGIAEVNQVAGDLNQVTSVVSVSVSVQ